MKIQLVDVAGQKSGTMTVSDDVFAVPMNIQLVSQVVHVYQSNARTASANAQTRGDVYGSRRKLWKQKGTGRARHGDRFAPQFVGGGASHGPTGFQNYKQTVNEKMRRKALFCMISQCREEGKLIVVDTQKKSFKKTADVAKFLSAIKTNGEVLVAACDSYRDLVRTGKNVDHVQILPVQSLNALVLADSDYVVMTSEGAKAFQSHFLKV